jgi:hypothetical protein
VAHPLDERDGREGQLGDGAALEERVEQAEDDEEHGGNDGAGLELGERELPRGILEAGLDAVHLLGPRGARGQRAGRGGGAAGLHGIKLAGVALDGGAEGVVGSRAVDEEPGDGLAEHGRSGGDCHHQEAVAIAQGGQRRGHRFFVVVVLGFRVVALPGTRNGNGMGDLDLAARGFGLPRGSWIGSARLELRLCCCIAGLAGSEL